MTPEPEPPVLFSERADGFVLLTQESFICYKESLAQSFSIIPAGTENKGSKIRNPFISNI
jgi:hypothetical protein